MKIPSKLLWYSYSLSLICLSSYQSLSNLSSSPLRKIRFDIVESASYAAADQVLCRHKTLSEGDIIVEEIKAKNQSEFRLLSLRDLTYPLDSGPLFY